MTKWFTDDELDVYQADQDSKFPEMTLTEIDDCIAIFNRLKERLTKLMTEKKRPKKPEPPKPSNQVEFVKRIKAREKRYQQKVAKWKKDLRKQAEQDIRIAIMEECRVANLCNKIAFMEKLLNL